MFIIIFLFSKLRIKNSLFILNPNLSSLPIQLIIKKLLIIIYIIITFGWCHLKVIASEKVSFDDFGLISIMYHRFNENKYPSTNIQLDIFKKQLDIIEKEGLKFINPRDFEESLSAEKKREKFCSQ